MSNPAFTAIKALLVPYAKHFKVTSDTDEYYSLEEDMQYSRTLFGYVHPSRGHARLGFYPLNVFPELHVGLPASIASKIKSKWVLTFPTVTAAEKKALAKLFVAAWQSIVAKRRVIGDDRGFYRKIRADETFAAVTRLLAKSPELATVTRHKSHVTVAFTPGVKLPATLASARKKNPDVIQLKTITPAQYDALAALIAKPARKSRGA